MLAQMLLTLALLQASPQAASQATPQPQDEPLTLPAIVYPPEARSARIQGTVHLQIAVDAGGNVFGVKVLDGPLPLRQAAVDAYTHATYRPLLKAGRPAPAIVTTAVEFNLSVLPPDSDQKLEQQFGAQHIRCQNASQGKLPDALETCRDALALARQFSPQSALAERAAAVNDVVLLLLAAKRYPEAAEAADEAITLVSGTSQPHTPAVATAYISRCEARSLAGQLPGAAADCAVAEETLTTLIEDQGKFAEARREGITAVGTAQGGIEQDQTANYRAQLRETYELHAIVLDKSHHPLEARRLRKQAAKV